MAKKNSWSNTESLFRFLRKNEAQSKKVKICYDRREPAYLGSIEGVITFFSPAYLRLQGSSPIIYLDDVKKIDFIS